MKIGACLPVLGLILVASLSAHSETTTPAAEAAADKVVSCTGSAGPRKLVVAAKGKGCELQYSKNDKTEVLATQKMGSHFCDEKLGKVREKLVAAGYKCE
jgi:hypothetical protein